MKAAVFDGVKIFVKDVPKPKIKENQVLIRIMISGICGTDISIIKGHLRTPVPIIPGHEFSGIIEEIGENVDNKYLNKKVTVEINSREGLVNCNCYFCKRGNYTNCLYRKALGIDINGSFAEYIAVDHYLCHFLADNISFEQGTFIEPLAAAVNTYEIMPFKAEDNFVVIYGAGKMGQLIAQVTKQYDKLYKHIVGTAPEVVMVSRSDSKLKIAKENGVDYIINSNKEDPVLKILEMTKGIGADIVVECTGNPEVMDQVVRSTRIRGKIALKSTHGLPVPINMTDIVVREISLYGTRCGPFDKAIKFLASGLIHLDNLISKKFELKNIVDAFKQAENSNNIKILIKCNNS